MKLSRRKFFAFALTAMSLSVVAALVLLLVADLFVHYRAERSAGLNRWGYRGPVASAKKSGQLRAVMLGGSTVFGYGVQWDQSIPANLERTLNASRPFSVINLGFNNEGAYSFVPTLRDFEYLDYDIVVLYEGYNDMPGDGRANTSVFRHNSAVFRLTGYFPILPMYLDEKAMMLRYGGDLGAAYAASRGDAPKTVFRPNIAARTSAAALDTVASVTNSLGAQLGRLSKVEAPGLRPRQPDRLQLPVGELTATRSMPRCVKRCRTGKRVLVVGQPRMSEGMAPTHAKQQRMLGAMIRSEFASQPHVVYIDLGDAVGPDRREFHLRQHALERRRQSQTCRGTGAARAGAGGKVNLRSVTLWLAFVATLAVIAYLSPEPDRVTDRPVYEATAQQFVVPDCADLHCFRVLMPWLLGSVPGPSLVKWKIYAVLANATAAILVLALSLAWALPARAAVMAATMSAFGFGALYTLHDVFTSDPLMFALGPALVLLLVRERFAMAAAVASAGVLAKEFAAAPVYVFSAASILQRRFPTAWRSLAAANCALIMWLLLQFTLMLRYNYGYGDNPSTHLTSGGYLAKWLSEQSPRGAAIAMFNEFGVLWLLAPIGLFLAPSRYAHSRWRAFRSRWSLPTCNNLIGRCGIFIS
jgi:hypothetical protein